MVDDFGLEMGLGPRLRKLSCLRCVLREAIGWRQRGIENAELCINWCSYQAFVSNWCVCFLFPKKKIRKKQSTVLMWSVNEVTEDALLHSHYALTIPKVHPVMALFTLYLHSLKSSTNKVKCMKIGLGVLEILLQEERYYIAIILPSRQCRCCFSRGRERGHWRWRKAENWYPGVSLEWSFYLPPQA